MKISVIIPVFNEEKYIKKCLESLKKQQEKPEEIIIVDNNCTDKTIEIAKKYSVEIIKEKKQGITFARNKGFEAAKYEILARCDADSILPVNWVKRIKEIFLTKKIDAITGPVIFYDLPIKTFFFTKAYLATMAKLQKGANTLIGPNMAISKKAWTKVKNKVCLNDKIVHEDIDLAIHINQVGGKIYVDEKLVVKVSGRRIKKNPFSFFIEYPIRLIKTLSTH